VSWKQQKQAGRREGKEVISIHFCLFLLSFFSIQRKSVAVIEKVLEVLKKKKLKGKHSQKVNSFSTFIFAQRLIQ